MINTILHDGLSNSLEFCMIYMSKLYETLFIRLKSPLLNDFDRIYISKK